jgi:hypothetical protein
MIEEQERILKKLFVAWLQYWPTIGLEELNKMAKNVCQDNRSLCLDSSIFRVQAMNNISNN